MLSFETEPENSMHRVEGFAHGRTHTPLLAAGDPVVGHSLCRLTRRLWFGSWGKIWFCFDRRMDALDLLMADVHTEG